MQVNRILLSKRQRQLCCVASDRGLEKISFEAICQSTGKERQEHGQSPVGSGTVRVSWALTTQVRNSRRLSRFVDGLQPLRSPFIPTQFHLEFVAYKVQENSFLQVLRFFLVC